MQKNNNSIVISSRIRFARNLASEKFPHMLGKEDGKRVFCRIANAAETLGKVYRLCDLPEIDAGIMLEKHLISPRLTANSDISGVVLSSDEHISIMINEEDHLREQCILPGLALEEAYQTLDKIDTMLDQKLGFAFDPALGYLSSCITNVGTGLRASVMLFLPGLSLSGKIASIAKNAKQIGIELRGSKGEESEEDGYLYQISNISSLGATEREIIKNVDSTVRKIVDLEIEERKILASSTAVAIKDMIYRAYAVLTGAYSLAVQEFNQMLSQVKLGAVLGILRFKNDQIFDKLFIAAQPCGLQKIAGHRLLGINENVFRADYVSQALKQNII